MIEVILLDRRRLLLTCSIMPLVEYRQGEGLNVRTLYEGTEYLIDSIRRRPIDDTEKAALILARRDQGLFKQRVRLVEVRCRITRVDRSSICARVTATDGATVPTRNVSTVRMGCCSRQR